MRIEEIGQSFCYTDVSQITMSKTAGSVIRPLDFVLYKHSSPRRPAYGAKFGYKSTEVHRSVNSTFIRCHFVETGGRSETIDEQQRVA